MVCIESILATIRLYLYLLWDLANSLSLFLSLTLDVIQPNKAAVLAASSSVVMPNRDPKITVSLDISPLCPMISLEVHPWSRWHQIAHYHAIRICTLLGRLNYVFIFLPMLVLNIPAQSKRVSIDRDMNTILVSSYICSVLT